MVNGQITTATFIVLSSATLGTYTVSLTGSHGDVAYATFVVQSTSPTVSLNPNSGPAGTVVAVSGSGFAASDTSCNIQSSPGTSIIGAFTCLVSNGVLTSASTFTVTAEPNPGTYTITITGGQANDIATTTFTVTGPHIALSPTSGFAGTAGSIFGGGFYTNDACTPASVTAPAGVLSGATCSMTNGQITSATFTVSSTAPLGTYTITVTGSHGDFATATFTVIPFAPTISVSPTVVPGLQVL